jgi:hypothetical protein
MKEFTLVTLNDEIRDIRKDGHPLMRRCAAHETLMSFVDDIGNEYFREFWKEKGAATFAEHLRNKGVSEIFINSQRAIAPEIPNSRIIDSKQLPFEGEEPDDFIDWAESVNLTYQNERHESISISNTGEDDTWMHVSPGDFVLLDENGLFHVVKNTGDLLPTKIDD